MPLVPFIATPPSCSLLLNRQIDMHPAANTLRRVETLQVDDVT